MILLIVDSVSINTIGRMDNIGFFFWGGGGGKGGVGGSHSDIFILSFLIEDNA